MVLRRFYEAHIPAKYAPPREEAWLPCTYGNSRRPRSSCCSPRQGPRQAHRITLYPKALVLPQKYRLTSPTDFSRATKSGIRVGSGNFFLYLYQTKDNLPPRAGLIISKAVGGSVVRHKVARRLRHEIAQHIMALPQGTLVVVRALTGAHDADVHKEIPTLLNKAQIKLSSVAR